MNQRGQERTELGLPAAQAAQIDEAADLTLRLLDDLGFADGDAGGQVGVRLWNGKLWPDDAPHAATIVLRHPGALRQMFLRGSELGLAEA